MEEWAKRSLRALPLELREVIVLKEILRWKPERIAATLGVDDAQVADRLLHLCSKIIFVIHEIIRIFAFPICFSWVGTSGK